jgi:hypothetical protein
LTEFLTVAHQAYLRVQLEIVAFENTHHNEAAGHFSDAINTIAVFSKSAIHPKFEVFSMVRWKIPHQLLLHASYRFLDGTLRRCGKQRIRNDVMHSFMPIDFERPSNRTDG